MGSEQRMLKLAINAAKAAGAILKEGLGAIHQIRYKPGEYNLVTEIDTRSERTIIDMIRAEYPDHTFLAEESGLTEAQPEFRWIIDPLDGTVNYAHGLPVFCVSIALEIRGEIALGVIYHPILDELFTAEKGDGAFLNGNPISVSHESDFTKTLLVTGFPYNSRINPHHTIDHFINFVKAGRPIRRLGSAALDLAYLACGRMDAFWEVSLNAWDVAAGSLLLTEAGGKITDLSGNPWTVYTEALLASNGHVHEDMLRVLTIAEKS